jgi:hypothetical protein
LAASHIGARPFGASMWGAEKSFVTSAAATGLNFARLEAAIGHTGRLVGIDVGPMCLPARVSAPSDMAGPTWNLSWPPPKTPSFPQAAPTQR